MTQLNVIFISMKLKIYLLFFAIFLVLTNCQTIKKKSDEVAEKENEKFGQFLGKQQNQLKLELGQPTEDYIGESGNEILVYKTKKYGIPCERKFEINTNGTVIKFSSSGCI